MSHEVPSPHDGIIVWKCTNCGSAWFPRMFLCGECGAGDLTEVREKRARITDTTYSPSKGIWVVTALTGSGAFVVGRSERSIGNGVDVALVAEPGVPDAVFVPGGR